MRLCLEGPVSRRRRRVACHESTDGFGLGTRVPRRLIPLPSGWAGCARGRRSRALLSQAQKAELSRVPSRKACDAPACVWGADPVPDVTDAICLADLVDARPAYN